MLLVVAREISVSLDPLALAGRALARGDALRALGLVGRAEDALGLTLRGIAYAQLGELALARTSLDGAAKLARDPLLRARVEAARVEIAMSDGDPAPAARAARASADALGLLGDVRNAAMQRLVLARAEVLLGRLAAARQVVDDVLKQAKLPEDVRAVACLAQAEIAIRAVAPTEARAALTRARRALDTAPNELLARALVALEAELSRPLARLEQRGALRDSDLFGIEAAYSGEFFLVDGCRRLVAAGRVSLPLARRPVLFALLLVLARAWPSDVARDDLAARAFQTKRVNASHRARLRVEIGRLRKVLEGLGEPVATADGYVLTTARDVAVLLPPSDDDTSRLALLLGDGAWWTAQALAEHAGVSKRTAQRALSALAESGGAVRAGGPKDLRYARPGAPIASRMLLLGLVSKT